MQKSRMLPSGRVPNAMSLTALPAVRPCLLVASCSDASAPQRTRGAPCSVVQSRVLRASFPVVTIESAPRGLAGTLRAEADGRSPPAKERDMQWSICARGIVTALVLGALAVHPVSAQITTGTVAGSVKDDQGLPRAWRDRHAHQRSPRHARWRRSSPTPPATSSSPTSRPTPTPSKWRWPASRRSRRPGVAVSGGDRVGVGELTLAVGGTSETVTVRAEVAADPVAERRALVPHHDRPRSRTCRSAPAATSRRSRR